MYVGVSPSRPIAPDILLRVENRGGKVDGRSIMICHDQEHHKTPISFPPSYFSV